MALCSTANSQREKRPSNLKLMLGPTNKSAMPTPSTPSAFFGNDFSMDKPSRAPSCSSIDQFHRPNNNNNNSNPAERHRALHLHPFRHLKHPQRFDHQHRHGPHLPNAENRIFNILATADNNSVSEVDYLLPAENRPLEVRVSNQSLFVDPKHLSDVSPQVSAFLLREFKHYGQSSLEPQLDDVSFEDLLDAVKALCPTELGIFPTPVTAHTFPILARLSSQFEVPRLKRACELFVARLPIQYQEITALQLAEMLHLACLHRFNLHTKLRLLQGCLALMAEEEKDSTHLPTYYAGAVDPVIAELIKDALAGFKRGAFAHDELIDEARLKVPCRMCRMEEPTTFYAQTDLYTHKVCRRCRDTTCFRCQFNPCRAQLVKFWERFGKNLKNMPEFDGRLDYF